MANNEGVDIIIKATDQYTKTINNIAASNKLFGNSIENTQKQIAALEKYMIALVANGISPTSASINVLQADLKLLNQTINTSGTSLKNSNKQWSALALVVQDLPYGFRGIQNNLPALFGSLATGAGAAYFAFSAVVAAITAWDMGLFKVFETTKKATDAQDDYNKALNSAISSGYGEISQIKALVSVVNNQTLSIDQRRTALKKLQDEYPGYFKNMSLEQTSVDDLTLSVGELTKAIIARAEATAMTLLDLFTKPSLVADAKKYFKEVQTKDIQYIPFITKDDPPAIHLNKEIQGAFRSQLEKFYYDPSKYGTYLEQLGITYPTIK